MFNKINVLIVSKLHQALSINRITTLNMTKSQGINSSQQIFESVKY